MAEQEEIEAQAPQKPRRKVLVRHRQKIEPAFGVTEHLCAFGYAASEFHALGSYIYAHEILMLGSAALLIFLGLMLLDRVLVSLGL